MNSLRSIHIGETIKKVLSERSINEDTFFNSLKLTSKESSLFFASKFISTEKLMKVSKILKFDFFRLYSNHLILFHAISVKERKKNSQNNTFVFRKNVYTIELIHFVLNQIYDGKMTVKQVISEYNIPKSTIYKWLRKYPKNEKAKL